MNVVFNLIFLLQHGRAKVKSSAEQEEAKKQSREEKVKVYKRVTNLIYTKVRLHSYPGKPGVLAGAMFHSFLSCQTLVSQARPLTHLRGEKGV